MTDLFVVYEGKGDVDSPNPAAAFSSETVARQSYDDTLSHGLADLNSGLYLGKLSGLTSDQVREVYENISTLADNEFEGYELEVLESYASSIDDWDADALDVGAEDAYDYDSEFVVLLPE